MAEHVAVTIDGTREVHATGTNPNYATLCGLDGDEGLVSPAGREKIDCPQCRAIWGHCKDYHQSEFKNE